MVINPFSGDVDRLGYPGHQDIVPLIEGYYLQVDFYNSSIKKILLARFWVLMMLIGLKIHTYDIAVGNSGLRRYKIFNISYARLYH